MILANFLQFKLNILGVLRVGLIPKSEDYALKFIRRLVFIFKFCLNNKGLVFFVCRELQKPIFIKNSLWRIIDDEFAIRKPVIE